MDLLVDILIVTERKVVLEDTENMLKLSQMSRNHACGQMLFKLTDRKTRVKVSSVSCTL